MAVRKRKPDDKKTQSRVTKPTSPAGSVENMRNWIRKQPVWIILAVGSGMCAAINGVFAKLTTTSLTSTLASNLASFLGLAEDNTYVNLALRGVFFGLNIVFNIAMWALFTAALTRSDSTTRTSIVNVSSNFFVTAILGAMIFSEKLPLGWWCGAALLAAGNVVIGRREEAEKPGGSIGIDVTRDGAQETENLLVEDREEDLLELRDSFDNTTSARLPGIKAGEDADNPL